MTDTMKTELRREAFEKWMREKHPAHPLTWRQEANRGDGVYLNSGAQHKWLGWCAALDSQAAQAQPSGEPKWIVNDMGELGVMVAGRAYFLYKGDNIIYESGLHDDGTPILYRMVGKREFGETCQPLPILRNKWPGGQGAKYLEPLVFTPGLSLGKPEDGAWQPLPASPSPNDPPSNGENAHTKAAVSTQVGGDVYSRLRQALEHCEQWLPVDCAAAIEARETLDYVDGVNHLPGSASNERKEGGA